MAQHKFWIARYPGEIDCFLKADFSLLIRAYHDAELSRLHPDCRQYRKISFFASPFHRNFYRSLNCSSAKSDPVEKPLCICYEYNVQQ